MDGQKSKYPNFIDLLVVVGVFVASMFAAAATMFILNSFNIEKELIMAIVYPVQFLPVIIFLHYYRKSRIASLNNGYNTAIGDSGKSTLEKTPESDSNQPENIQNESSLLENTIPTGNKHKESFKKTGRQQDGSLLVRLAPRAMNLPLTLWGIVLMLAVSILIEPLLGLFPDKYFDMIDTAIGRGGWAFLTTVVMAPILEEWLFRGQILGSIKGKYGPAAALIISALLFGLIHGIPPQVVNAFFLGLILGYVYLKTGSLLSVIVMHAANNALAYLQMMMADDASATLRQSVGSDTLYFMIYGACVVLFIVGITGMVKTVKKSSKEHKQ